MLTGEGDRPRASRSRFRLSKVTNGLILAIKEAFGPYKKHVWVWWEEHKAEMRRCCAPAKLDKEEATGYLIADLLSACTRAPPLEHDDARDVGKRAGSRATTVEGWLRDAKAAAAEEKRRASREAKSRGEAVDGLKLDVAAADQRAQILSAPYDPGIPAAPLSASLRQLPHGCAPQRLTAPAAPRLRASATHCANGHTTAPVRASVRQHLHGACTVPQRLTGPAATQMRPSVPHGAGSYTAAPFSAPLRKKPQSCAHQRHSVSSHVAPAATQLRTTAGDIAVSWPGDAERLALSALDGQQALSPGEELRLAAAPAAEQAQAVLDGNRACVVAWWAWEAAEKVYVHTLCAPPCKEWLTAVGEATDWAEETKAEWMRACDVLEAPLEAAAVAAADAVDRSHGGFERSCQLLRWVEEALVAHVGMEIAREIKLNEASEFLREQQELAGVIGWDFFYDEWRSLLTAVRVMPVHNPCQRSCCMFTQQKGHSSDCCEFKVQSDWCKECTFADLRAGMSVGRGDRSPYYNSE